MTYTVNFTNPSTPAISVSNTTVNTTSTSIALLGQNYDNYGELVAENFLKMLENFSYATAPANPIPGQLWHDTSTKTLKLRDSLGTWKPLSAIYNGTVSPPPSITDKATGDIYIDTTSGRIFAYSGSSWVEIAPTSMGSKVRLDSGSVSHTTIEAVIGTFTVFVISLEDGWVPKSTETLPDSSVMNVSFPILNKGINFNITGTGYGLHGLAKSTIDVGRGKVTLENNSADNANGAGITLKTTVNPTTGSIFSVRNSTNAAKLWAGEAFTSSGVNSFYIGSSTSGSESDAALYKIKLTNAGDVIALTASGAWLATDAEAVNNGIINKLMTPKSTRTAIDTRVSQLIADDALLRASQAEAIAAINNDQVMTPLRTKDTILGSITTQALAEAGTDNLTLMTPLRTAQEIIKKAPASIATIQVGAIGSYAYLAGRYTVVGNFTAGSTYPGSGLYYAGGTGSSLSDANTAHYVDTSATVDIKIGATTTWRAMGSAQGSNTGGDHPYNLTLMLRIS